jgi:hypothetical protein
MAPGASTGEHGRDFCPVCDGQRIPPDKWANCLSLMSVRHCDLILIESGSVLPGTAY